MSDIEQLPEKLKKLLDNPPYSCLFEGPKGSRKAEYANLFARKLLNTVKKYPPDLRCFYPEGKGNHYPIYTIKRLIEEVQLSPYEADHKVFIIHEADRMLPISANALLKTLEESVSRVTIILLTSRLEGLLPTIVSRCFRIAFKKETTSERGILSEQMFHIGLRLLKKDLPTNKELPEIDNIEEALSYLFYFYRDLQLIRLQGNPALLFYKDKEDLLSSIKESTPSLDVIQEKMETLLFATTLHIPLGHALTIFI